MKYILIQATNETGVWQANISASDNGFTPTGASYHLLMGNHPITQDALRITTGEILTMVGWAIADQMEEGEYDYMNSIREQGEGARDLIRAADESTEFVVQIEAGGISKDEAVQRLTYGGEARKGGVRQIQAA